jgi:hypothetical protein
MGRFRNWLEMQVTDADFGWGKVWYANVINDEFLHFTPRSRAEEIFQSGKLLMRPPYEKFGTDTVDGISLTFGSHLPSVQTTHIGDEDIVAIRFKTDTIPHYGVSDEVKWIGDVNLINPQIMELNQAVQLLQSVQPPETFDADDDQVIYVDPKTYEKVHRIHGEWDKPPEGEDPMQYAHGMLQQTKNAGLPESDPA